MSSSLVVVTSLAVLLVTSWTDAAMDAVVEGGDCVVDPDLCTERQCCVMNGTIGQCKDMPIEGDQCEMKPVTVPEHTYVYMNMCPCEKPFSCGEDEDDTNQTVCLSDMDYDPEQGEEDDVIAEYENE